MTSENPLRDAIDDIRGFREAGLGGRILDAAEVILAAYYELSNAITWDTTCLNCASLLDKNYEYYVALEQIRDLTLDDVDADVYIDNNSILEVLHSLES